MRISLTIIVLLGGLLTLLTACSRPGPDDIESWMLTDDIAALSDVEEFSKIRKDRYDAIAQTAPSSLEGIMSWEQLLMGDVPRTRGVVLDVVRYEMGAAASEAFERTIDSGVGWEDLAPAIGERAAYRDIDAPTSSGMLSFWSGPWVVILHTEHGAERQPLLDREGLISLARTIAGRIPED